jgi:hypothetical protein
MPFSEPANADDGAPEGNRETEEHFRKSSPVTGSCGHDHQDRQSKEERGSYSQEEDTEQKEVYLRIVSAGDAKPPRVLIA